MKHAGRPRRPASFSTRSSTRPRRTRGRLLKPWPSASCFQSRSSTNQERRTLGCQSFGWGCEQVLYISDGPWSGVWDLEQLTDGEAVAWGMWVATKTRQE